MSGQQERDQRKALLLRKSSNSGWIWPQPSSLAGSHLAYRSRLANAETPAFMGDGRQRGNGYLVSTPSALFNPLGQTRPRHLEHLADGQRDSAPVRIALIARSVRQRAELLFA